MNGKACSREAEALAVSRNGFRPGEELESHLRDCGSCRDLVTVASRISVDARLSAGTARVPSSGLVWWRIQQRSRQEAMRSASRAVTVVQAVSVAAGVVVATGIVGAMSSLDWLAQLAPSHLWNAATAAQWTAAPLLGVVACLALAPVALYFAVAGD